MRKLLTAPLVIFLLLFVYGVLRSLTTSQRDRQRRMLIFLLLLTMGLAVLSMPVVTAQLVKTLERVHPYPPPQVLATVDFFTVLSSNVHHGAGAGRPELDQASYIRTTVGARAFIDASASLQPGPRLLVLQGSLGGEQAETMAAVMAELAEAMGVPSEQIRVESRSRSTREHPVELLRLGEIVETDVIGVVTSAWHLPRAVIEFERHFDRVVPIPADYLSRQLTGTINDWIPQARALAETSTVVHEWIGRLWYLGLSVSPWAGSF